jgi:hypothetical protein
MGYFHHHSLRKHSPYHPILQDGVEQVRADEGLINKIVHRVATKWCGDQGIRLSGGACLR